MLRLGEDRRPDSPGVARGGWAAAGVLAVVATLALGLPGAVTDAYHSFVQGDVLPGQAQVSDRLTSIGADGRVTLWKIALHEFEGAPVAGTGAGTYEVVYATHRTSSSQVVNAHLDWDWQMPAATLPFFAVAGASLAREGSARTARRRPLLAIAVLVATIAPTLIEVSQHHLAASLAGFARNNCGEAARQASDSLTPTNYRQGAHEILAYCAAARGNR